MLNQKLFCLNKIPAHTTLYRDIQLNAVFKKRYPKNFFQKEICQIFYKSIVPVPVPVITSADEESRNISLCNDVVASLPVGNIFSPVKHKNFF
jgi:hypothetical protein